MTPRVERRHREAAWQLLRPVQHSAATLRWLETGECDHPADLLFNALRNWAAFAAQWEAYGRLHAESSI